MFAIELIEVLEKNNVKEFGIEKEYRMTGESFYSVWIENTPQEIFDFLDTKDVIKKESGYFGINTIDYVINDNGMRYELTTWIREEEEEEEEPDWDNLEEDEEEED
jgi:hypothetical protein